ncbi:hypothetical protein HBN54_003738 [Hymenobacter sp. 1B]|uniref:Uncharacterized protein n=1 Tax=Hymenobacter artigasi TaxID=2719616 RepID=A0ABX1HLI2_9BACT|nr:hypothetical protein [Hymenobacter artigasi]
MVSLMFEQRDLRRQNIKLTISLVHHLTTYTTYTTTLGRGNSL